MHRKWILNFDKFGFNNSPIHGKLNTFVVGFMQSSFSENTKKRNCESILIDGIAFFLVTSKPPQLMNIRYHINFDSKTIRGVASTQFVKKIFLKKSKFKLLRPLLKTSLCISVLLLIRLLGGIYLIQPNVLPTAFKHTFSHKSILIFSLC